MKRILLLLLPLVLVQIPTKAQDQPQGIHYQAAARNLDGTLLKNQDIALEFVLYFMTDESQPRTEAYSEYHRVRTDQLGLFNVNIGYGDPVQGEYRSVPWSTQNIWVEVGIDAEGLGNFTAISNSQLPIEVACVINSKFPACSTSPVIIMTLRPYKSIILLVRPTESRLAQASMLNIKVVSVRLDWVCSAMNMVVKGQMKLLLETLKNTPAKSSQKREG